MKLYHLEYDFEFPNGSKEHRKYSSTDLSEFIKKVKSVANSDKWYISNVKTYVGVLQEIDPNQVIDPF